MLDTAVAAFRSVLTYVVILVYIAVAAPLALVIGVRLALEAGDVSRSGTAASGWR